MKTHAIFIYKALYLIIFALIFLPLTFLWGYSLLVLAPTLQQIISGNFDYGDVILLLLPPISGFTIFCAYYASFKLAINQNPTFNISKTYHFGIFVGCLISLYFSYIIGWLFVLPLLVIVLLYAGIYMQNNYSWRLSI
ncbi:MAG: hypothetical protein HWE16_00795 [Gammaproteobacteria bacterium]|nr:hypothetical protein [Gammaproteobacteria bacterium]